MTTPWALPGKAKPRKLPPEGKVLPRVTLFQTPGGEWMIRINGGQPLIATDSEVALWLLLHPEVKP